QLYSSYIQWIETSKQVNQMCNPLTSYIISVSNCFKKRISFSENNLKSLITYFKFVILSIPIPKAKPLYLLLSIPQFSRTLGSTIPHPKISTQPLPLHMVHPAPLQIEQEISISADGSVNGK